jgi:uncharacterized protein (DUF2062 family)
MNARRWMHEHSLKLLAIRDTPEAIAGGVAIGVFFGFTPLVGLKTLLSIFFAWLTGTNILAAVLAATAHDIVGPFISAIYLWEYDLGYWVLNHKWPPSVVKLVLTPQTWRSWTTFVTVGKPLLLGAALCGAPMAAAAYFLSKRFVARHQRKKHAHEAAAHQG